MIGTYKPNGEAIRQLITDQFWTVKALARKSKIAPATIHRMIRSKQLVTPRTITALAQSLNVTPDQIVKEVTE